MLGRRQVIAGPRNSLSRVNSTGDEARARIHACLRIIHEMLSQEHEATRHMQPAEEIQSFQIATTSTDDKMNINRSTA